MKHRGLLTLLVLAPLGALRALGACGCGEEPATPSEAGADARGDVKAPDAKADVDPWDAGPSSCPAGPSGWILDTQYDEACGFCYPSDKKLLPKPIAWEACGPSALPNGALCKQMVFDWQASTLPQGGGEHVSPFAVGWAHDGTVALGFSRFEGVLGYRMVADVDGDVRLAMLETDSSTCTLGRYDVHDSRAAFRVYSYAAGKDTAGGAYGVDFDTLQPRLYVNRKAEPGTISRSYYVSKLGMFETHAGLITQIDWTTAKEVRTIDSAATNGGYVFGNVSPGSTAVFWDGYVGTKLNEIRVWLPDDAGARDWLSFGNDWTQGAGDFATDDKDMVWSEGHGRASPNGYFDEMRVLTAPRNDLGPADAGRVIGKIHPYGIGGGDDTAVGCGFAARTAAPPSGDAMPPETVFIYRLSDGRRWELQQSSSMVWKNVLAITCDEVFVSVGVQADGGKPSANIARVRLDSLGAGLPAP